MMLTTGLAHAQAGQSAPSSGCLLYNEMRLLLLLLLLLLLMLLLMCSCCCVELGRMLLPWINCQTLPVVPVAGGSRQRRQSHQAALQPSPRHTYPDAGVEGAWRICVVGEGFPAKTHRRQRRQPVE